MTDINSVVLCGRLTRDAELKYTSGGMAIADLSIAVNSSKKVGDTWEDQANFFDVSLFGKRAEALTPYLTKGVQLAVSGSLSQDRWERDGQKRSKVTIKANNIQLMSIKSESQPRNEPEEDLDGIPF